MAAPYYLTMSSGGFAVLSGGGSVTSAATLIRPYPLGILVPSLSAASEVRLQFAMTSGGGGTGDVWADLQKLDGTGDRYVIYSGPGPGWGYLPFAPPTPNMRVSCVASQSSVRTFQIVEVLTYN